MKYKLNDIEKNRIEGIVARLSNAVDTYAIMQWLENFEEGEDRSHALTLLEKMEYRSADAIYATIKQHLTYLGIHHKSCKIYMVPFGKLGKSGSLIAYYTNKSISRDNEEKFIILSPEELKNIKDETIGERDVLCLMDDFVGSGSTLKKAYEEYRASYEQFNKRYAFLIGYLPRGEEVMKGYGLKILGDPYEPIFKRRGSVLGYEPRMKALREFAYKYGKRLVSNSKRTKQYPLGYMNSQALVAFDYTCPNNTLPIFWASKPYKRKGEWHPLFPRFAPDFVKRLSATRRSYGLWIGENKKLKSPFEFINNNDDYTIQKVQLFLLLELIHARRSRNVWGTLMGLTSVELEELIKDALKYKFIDGKMHLTENASRLLREVQKARRKLSGEEPLNEINNEVYKYVPRQFMGGT